MAAKPTHDIAIKTGEYQNANGETKGRWLNIGTVFRHDDGGTTLKLDAIPVGLPEWQGWCSVFKREPRDGSQNATSGTQRPQAARSAPAPATTQQDFDDDIPF